MPPRFQGFPPGGLRFLRDLERHNERAWFAARKAVYDEQVAAPMRLLVDELSDRFAQKRIPVYGDLKRSIFRIYRDVRFSRDKKPYKTHAAAYLSPDGGRHTPGGLYIHVAPKEAFLGIAFYQMAPPLVARWRREMSEDPATFERVLRDLRRAKLKLEPPDERDDSLVRLPRGFTHVAGTPLEPYFRLRHFLIHEDLTSEDLSSRKLVDRSVRFVERSIPLLAYGWRLADSLAAG